MFDVRVNKLAEDFLKGLSLKSKISLRKILGALDSLEELGLESSNIKKLRGKSKIFRKRIGRFRILFTMQDKKIDIWVIAIEKDSKKDYPRWISYISDEI